jgi:hypothetical protein
VDKNHPLHDANWPSTTPLPDERVERVARFLVLASVVLGAVAWFVFWVIPHDASIHASLARL